MTEKEVQEMYCLKCKEKKFVEANIQSSDGKRGTRWMYKGICPECGTRMSKMTKAPDKDQELKKKD